MKKLIFTTVIVFSAILFSHAQQKGDIAINVGADLGLPIGDFGNGFDMGYGGTVKGLYSLNEQGQIGVTLGYMSFGVKNTGSSGVNASMGVIPIFAVYRHAIGNLYLEPQVGISMNKVKVNGMSGFGGMSASSSGLGYAVGAGYMINAFDISVRYQAFSQSGSSSGFAGVRLAYNFALGR